MNLPMLDADKANHVVYGVVSGLLGGAVAHLLGVPVALGAAGLATVAGVGKEIMDKRGTGTVDAKDAIATALGGVAVAAGSVLGAL